jgi:hypothetical protein
MDALETLLVQEKELFTQKQSIEDSLSRVHVRIAEVRDLNRSARTYNIPDEVLSAIFEAGDRPLARASSLWKKGSHIPFEILVSSVSRRWRNVALQTPQLWTVVKIKVAQSTHDLYDLYLHRSKICLMDIQLSNASPKNKQHHDTKLKRHLARLIPHIARWRTFIIRGGHVESPSTVLSMLSPLCAPALETLGFDIDCPDQPTMDLFSAGTPRLSSVELKDVSFLRLPIETVKYAKLGGGLESRTNHAQFDQLMQSMHSLTHLSMYSNMIGESANYPPIEIPTLLSLEYRREFTTTGGIGDLGCLDLPALQTLTVRDSCQDVIEVFVEHHRLYPLVRSLTIVVDDYPVTSDTPVAAALVFISLFPNIQDITFQRWDPTPILAALCDRLPTDETLWPHLSSITIVLSMHIKVALKKQIWAYIVKLVPHRLQLGNPISKVMLSSHVVERGTQRQVRRLREQVEFVRC